MSDYARVTARTAYVGRRCDNCRNAINRGQRYLEHVAAPKHTDLGNTRWQRIKECADCAWRHGRASLLVKGGEQWHGVSDEVLTDLLSLVDVTVPPERMATWTPEQRAQAADWAAAVHLNASDNDVPVPPKPSFLDDTQCKPTPETFETPPEIESPTP